MKEPTLTASSLSVLISAFNSSTYTVLFKPHTTGILLFRQRFSVIPQTHFVCNFFFVWRFEAIPGHALPLRGFGITLTGYTTLGRTALDERSIRHKDLCFKTHHTHNRQTSMPLAGFEPTIPPSERPQTVALNHAVTGIGI